MSTLVLPSLEFLIIDLLTLTGHTTNKLSVSTHEIKVRLYHYNEKRSKKYRNSNTFMIIKKMILIFSFIILNLIHKIICK